MSKTKITMLLWVLTLTLVGCSRQQGGVDTVFFREKPSDFTTLPQEAQPSKVVVPPIPGKAVIAGAPFVDFPTQTGSAVSNPNQPVPTVP